MNKFNTFDELVVERKRLQGDLHQQKDFIRSELIEIRDRFKPIVKVVSFFAHFGHSNGSTAGNLLRLGSNIGIDLLVGQKLKKAGWLAKLVLPLVMKFTTKRAIGASRRG